MIVITSSTNSSQLLTLDKNGELKGKQKDACLKVWATPNAKIEFLSKEHLGRAEKIVECFKTADDKTETKGIISGSLAAGATLSGFVPILGPVIGAPLSFAANHQGFTDGVRVGNMFARAGDMRQDLILEVKEYYRLLAKRMLTRYIRTDQIKKADELEKNYGMIHRLLNEKERASMNKRRDNLVKMAQEILRNLKTCDTQASRIISPKEKQEILKPLEEVCEYVAGTRKKFTVEGLSNEKHTKRSHYEGKLRTKVDEFRRDQDSLLRVQNVLLIQEIELLREQLSRFQKKSI